MVYASDVVAVDSFILVDFFERFVALLHLGQLTVAKVPFHHLFVKGLIVDRPRLLVDSQSRLLDLGVLQLLFVVHVLQLVVIQTTGAHFGLVDHARSQRLQVRVIGTDELRVDGPASDGALSAIDLRLLQLHFVVIDQNRELRSLHHTALRIELDDLSVCTGLDGFHICAHFVRSHWVLPIRRTCSHRVSRLDVSDLGRGDVHHSSSVGESALRFVLHVLVRHVEVESIGLIHRRVGVLLPSLGPLLGRRGYVPPQVIGEARLAFAVFILGHSESLLFVEVVAQRAVSVYVVVDTAQKFESDDFFVVQLRVVLLILIDDFGELHHFRPQEWLKFDKDVVELHVSLVLGLAVALFELYLIEYFDVDSFAQFVEPAEIPLFDQLINGVSLLLGFDITGLELILDFVV